jgi:hypothetical protein
MKWFFALNEGSPNFDKYADLIKVAVVTARRRTSLKPYFLYDGAPNPLTAWLDSKGVTVVPRRWRLLDRFREVARESGSTDLITFDGGIFLRTEIPGYCAEQGWDDEEVLYTDCDVMFTGDPGPLLPDLRGFFLGLGPESDMAKPDEINSGVMLMRLPAFRRMDEAFQRFIELNLAECARSTDQFAYREFFRHGWKPLPAELNWKPYWGENRHACIVHFHGPKPFLRPVIEAGGGLPVHRALARGAYTEYCRIWEHALADAG